MQAIPASETASPALWQQRPQVSVIMLTRDHEPYLAEAVSSVIAQRLEGSLELLIGEDCSADGTLALALALQRQWPAMIRVIHAEVNVGIRDNFLRLLVRARAPLIAVLEGDDRWVHPHKLALQSRLLRADPSLACVGGITLNRPPLGPPPGRDRLDLVALLRRYVVHSSALVFWRDLALPYPNFPEGALDSMLLAVLTARGDCGWIGQPLSWYRRHRGGYWSGAQRSQRLRLSLDCIAVIGAYLGGRYGRELAARELWIHRLDWPLPADNPWRHWLGSWQILWRRGPRLLVLAPLGLLGLVLWTATQPAALLLVRLRRGVTTALKPAIP